MARPPSLAEATTAEVHEARLRALGRARQRDRAFPAAPVAEDIAAWPAIRRNIASRAHAFAHRHLGAAFLEATDRVAAALEAAAREAPPAERLRRTLSEAESRDVQDAFLTLASLRRSLARAFEGPRGRPVRARFGVE